MAPAAVAAIACFGALFFSGGFDDDALVWIGGIVLAAAAITAAAVVLGALPAPRLDGPALLFLGSLLGLTIWVGLSTWWSLSPDRSWAYTNRTLVYAAFALLGLLLPVATARVAAGAALLLGLVIGWALLAKCVPGIYTDYGRIARLRAPVGYWNELALLCAVAVPLALWVARSRRAVGALLLYGAVVALLLTYSRTGVVLALLTAAGWVALDRDRVESLLTLAVAGGLGVAVFGVALALPGITDDGQPRSVRAHDGWIFALVLLAGAVLVVAAAAYSTRLSLSAERRRTIERVAAGVALVLAVGGLALSIVFAGRIWGEFANPVSSQISSGSAGRLTSANSSNRWRWWSEAWQAFVDHPLGGTGAGTFVLTDERLRRTGVVTTTEPHNVPLQFLSETGIVGFLLYLGVAAGALWAAARKRAPAETALALGVAAFFLHGIVDFDWNFVATSGPLLLVAGALARQPAPERVRVRRPLLAVGAVLFAAAAVYSLAAPWLARRALADANPKQAHAYDPLSTQALIDWAAFEDADGNVLHAAQLYDDAVALEPESSDTWFALGLFYRDHGAWRRAYDAFSKAWTYDRFGPAGVPCGELDQARHKVTGTWPPSCPGGRPASTPAGGSG